MKQRSGFTLIELLVVIAIIAILAAILFPVFARADKARQAQCQSGGKQLATAMMMYLQDFDDRFPLCNYQVGGNGPWASAFACYTYNAAWGDSATSCSTLTSRTRVYGHVQVILGRRNGGQAIICRSAISPTMATTWAAVCGWEATARMQPEDVDDHHTVGYGNGCGSFSDCRSYLGTGWGMPRATAAPITSSFGTRQPPYVSGSYAANPALAEYRGMVGGGAMWRHAGGMNVIFCDGHVKHFKPGGDLCNPDTGCGTVRALHSEYSNVCFTQLQYRSLKRTSCSLSLRGRGPG